MASIEAKTTKEAPQSLLPDDIDAWLRKGGPTSIVHSFDVSVENDRSFIVGYLPDILSSPRKNKLRPGKWSIEQAHDIPVKGELGVTSYMYINPNVCWDAPLYQDSVITVASQQTFGLMFGATDKGMLHTAKCRGESLHIFMARDDNGDVEGIFMCSDPTQIR